MFYSKAAFFVTWISSLCISFPLNSITIQYLSAISWSFFRMYCAYSPTVFNTRFSNNIVFVSPFELFGILISNLCTSFWRISKSKQYRIGISLRSLILLCTRSLKFLGVLAPFLTPFPNIPNTDLRLSFNFHEHQLKSSVMKRTLQT
jgi:hypothetical protein